MPAPADLLLARMQILHTTWWLLIIQNAQRWHDIYHFTGFNQHKNIWYLRKYLPCPAWPRLSRVRHGPAPAAWESGAPPNCIMQLRMGPQCGHSSAIVWPQCGYSVAIVAGLWRGSFYCCITAQWHHCFTPLLLCATIICLHTIAALIQDDLESLTMSDDGRYFET